MARILVAERNQALERLLTVILETKGYEVVTAANGEEALRKFYGEDDFDLVIMEMYLPELTASELVSIIRRDAGIPLMVMGDYLYDAPVVLAGGADYFLKKPVTYETLIEAVATALH